VAVGEKLAVTVHFLVGARELPQLLLTVKGGVDDATKPLMVSVLEPLFVRVICLLDVDPTPTFPMDTDELENVAVCP
jgi:hypothetical protein